MNWQYAMELLLTGDRIGAERAKEIGLAGWVVPHHDLMDEARALAGRLVAAAPLAARATKEVAVRSRAAAGRSHPVRRDHAPGGGGHRGRFGGSAGRPRGTPGPVAGTLRSNQSGGLVTILDTHLPMQWTRPQMSSAFWQRPQTE